MREYSIEGRAEVDERHPDICAPGETELNEVLLRLHLL